MAVAVLRVLPAPADDRTLVDRCVAGDRAAQHELFMRERARVHSIVYRVLGSNAAIDDVLQEAFVQIFRSLRLWRGDASLATWIDRCAVRAARRSLRRKRTPTVPLELIPEPVDDDPGVEGRVDARRAASRLYQRLAGMSDNLRIAFVLAVIEERPLAEVASVMEATVVATKARVWRARRLLERWALDDPALRTFLPRRLRDATEAPE
jgi:RNA polymerase sigma-70 factor (ECF subfamily)